MSERIPGEELSASDAGSVSMERLRAEYPRFSWKVFLIWVVAATAFTIPVMKESGAPTEMSLLLGVAAIAGVFSALLYYGGYVAFRRAAYGRMLKRLEVARLTLALRTFSRILSRIFSRTS